MEARNGDILAWAATQGYVWIHGLIVTMVCVDDHGLCYHWGPIQMLVAWAVNQGYGEVQVWDATEGHIWVCGLSGVRVKDKEDVCGLGCCLSPCWCPSVMLSWMQESMPYFSLNCSPISDLGMGKVAQCLMSYMQESLPCPSQGQKERTGLNVWMQKSWFCPYWGKREARQRPGLTKSAATQTQN